MKTIVRANSLIENVIGEQQVKDTNYRLLRYVLKVDTEDGLLLHNVISGQLVLLTAKEQNVLDLLPMKSNELIQPLIESYFIVPVDFNERQFVQGYRKVLQQIEKNKRKPITKYTIFPTTRCNAHCFYCFESGYKKINMDQTTAENVAKFICHNADGNQVEIGWFGGEPTVEMKRIDYICSLLREYEVDYVSGMISNGYLFSASLVKQAVDDWHLKSIQITLDGTEEIYNRTKMYRNASESAYKRVLHNISLLLDAGVRVTVLLNLDYHNCDDLFNLIDELSARYKQYGNFRLSSHVLFNNEGYEKVHHTYQQEEELAKLNYKLADHIAEVGLTGTVMGDVRLRKSLPILRCMHCMTNDSGSVVIAPNGKLFRCEHIDDDLMSATGVETGGIRISDLDEWFVAKEKEQCFDCYLYPDCFVPQKCSNQAHCYPIDKAKKIAGCKENIRNVYGEFTQKELEKSGIGG